MYKYKNERNRQPTDDWLWDTIPNKDVILNSLPKIYLSFLTHFRMTKPTVNYHDLLGMLQNFVEDHQLYKLM